MTDAFRALRLYKTDTGQEARFVDLTDDDLMPGDVTVRVDFSTVNYKDGLALTGKAPVVRVWPLTPGIDFAGVVETSDRCRVQRRRPGGAERLGRRRDPPWRLRPASARVKGDWLVKLPDAISTAHAMAIGTAGYTAMLGVMALERVGVTPDMGDVRHRRGRRGRQRRHRPPGRARLPGDRLHRPQGRPRAAT